MWGSMTAAYDALSEPIKTLLEGLEVHHDSTDFVQSVIKKLGPEQAKAMDIEAKLDAEYPGVDQAILDDDLFNDLSALITFFSGGAINFDSASQAVSMNARCGLIPQLVGNIRD